MMFRLTIILILGLCRISLSQSLSGQVFILSESFIDDKCEVIADCDCCGTDLFFLSSTRFGFVSRCLSGDSYFTGTYTLKTNRLILNFNKKYVIEIVDEEYNVTNYKTEQIAIDKIEFEIQKCGQNLRLTHSTTLDWRNGSRYSQSEEKMKFNKLLSAKPWKQLTD